MILQSLCGYYQRKADLGEIAPFGLQYQEIPFVIVIDRNGNFIQIEDTREKKGKYGRAKKILVPAEMLGRSGKIGKNPKANKSNLLWDNPEFVFGLPKTKSEVDLKRILFLEKLKKTFSESPASDIVAPLIWFLENNPVQEIERILNERKDETALKNWNELSQNTTATGSNKCITFRMDGDLRTFAENKELLRAYLKNKETKNPGFVRCLITGVKCNPEETHPKIKNVSNAQSSGASIISFNEDAFESFGKKQNHNAPVSPEAIFQYTTALNQLLETDSPNRVIIGDTTTVFWAERKNPLEDDFPSLFGSAAKDNPDSNLSSIRNLCKRVFTGKDSENSATRFYILGLAPSNARISVRFWLSGTVSEFDKNIKQHFDDLEIQGAPYEPVNYSLGDILLSLAPKKKKDKEDKKKNEEEKEREVNAPPVIAGDIAKAIFTGGLYPQTMLQQTLRRIRATQDVSRIHAAILKAYFNRFNRIYQKPEKEITMSLDTENKNIGYLLGRLFSTLERVQEDANSAPEKIQGDANPRLNATIKDRFYGAASATPVTVFPQLLKLAQHHLSKIRKQDSKKGQDVEKERNQLLTEIFDGIPSSGFPAHLSMQDQARFAIGYYHQLQNFKING
jgi:CRISPR-associated protein Csd1